MTEAPALRLAEIAERFSLELQGDGDLLVRGVCTLTPGAPDRLGFLSNPRYRPQLKESRAGAVVMGAKDAQGYAGNALIAGDPYLSFARIAALFQPAPRRFGPLRHPSAVIADDAEVAASARIGAHAVIGPGARIGEEAVIGPGVVIDEEAEIGARSECLAGAHIGARCLIGADCRIGSGVVIGGRGFGLARGPEGWEDVPQLGAVRIGDRVEIGANTCIDRGAIGDTVIGDGVKLDNLIQIGHNVQIGAHTAIAACVGISGSTRIGSNCLIGGGCGVNGHIEIADGVMIQGFTMVTHSLDKPGVYGSGWPVEESSVWHGQLRRLKRLERLEKRLAALESLQKAAHRDD